ncbi:MAG: serine/threonine protein kinase [Nocardioidaceae bacterium]|nr:serine/threonine protein kinase [Nocardioidaceae bacterium]MCL2612633.1 serine/threonine protein kinase [Nocardioidaceae bacterium]
MTSQPVVPTRVGEYTLLARLGEGGMGIVHLARAADGRRVALKVLRPQVVGDDEARARLAREVASLERVRSPWIAEVIDAAPWAEVPYVVTRYVPGLSLYDHVAEEGPVPDRDLLWLAGCLAEGVSAVHRAGVLHRDIKPSNVLMEGRTPILIDFGLARVADDPRLTQTGFLLGTPGYLAPEILYGDDATPAADVHAWAATVAYAATGRAPYGKGPAMAVLDRARRGQHDLGGIPQPLAGVIDASLAPDPLDRPLLGELLAWLKPLSTDPEAPQVPPPGRGVFGDLTQPYTPAGRPAGPAVAAPPTVRPPESPTAVIETERAPAPRTDAMGRVERDWDDQHVDAALSPARVPLGERLRRAVAVLAGAALVGAGLAAAPWPVLVALLVLVWALRAGSLAASAVADRRTLRGRKWYDAPGAVVTGPWHVLRAVTGAVVLVLWATGIGAAAGLVGYALDGLGISLFLAGLAAALALWTGPGSDRFRPPVGRVLYPLARSTTSWLVVSGVLLVLAGALGLLVATHGTDWMPASSGPFGL